MLIWMTGLIVVQGAGLTGTTVAARLAENKSISVLLIEVRLQRVKYMRYYILNSSKAGNDDRTNPNVYSIYNYGAAFNGPLDWAWPTDQGKVMHGGKTLGGSSSINGGHWTRGLIAQYDAWTQLLETTDSGMGWNWAGLFTYMKKVRCSLDFLKEILIIHHLG